MIDIDVEKLTFDTALQHFSDEINQKDAEVSNTEIEFIRKFEGLVTSNDHHPQLIKYSTKIIQDFDKIFKDLQYHFSELKMEFVFNLIEKMFKVMIFGYKLLSQAFLKRYKEEKSIKYLGIQNKNNFNSLPQDRFMHEKHQAEKNYTYKKMEFLSYVLDQLDRKDEQMETELGKYLSTITLKKQAVKNIIPSFTISKIIQIQSEFAQILSQSDQLFQASFRTRHDQIKKLSNEVEKPKKMEKIFNDELKKCLKQNFMKGIKKVICYFEQKFKFKLQQKIGNQSQILSCFAEQIQEQTQTKDKELQKEKKITQLEDQLTEVKKSLEYAEKQKSIVKNKLEATQKAIQNLKQENTMLENVLKSKSVENKHEQIENERLVSQKTLSIKHLNKKIERMKESSSSWKHIQIKSKNKEVQTTISNNNFDEISQKNSLAKMQKKKVPVKKGNFKNNLVNSIETINDFLDVTEQKDKIEKQIYEIRDIKDIENVIGKWCNQVKRIMTQKHVKMAGLQIKSVKWNKKIEKTSQTKTIGIQTRTPTIAQTSVKNSPAKTPIILSRTNSKNEQNGMLSSKKQLITSKKQITKKLKQFKPAIVHLKKSKKFTKEDNICEKSQDEVLCLQSNLFPEYINKASFQDLNMKNSHGQVKGRNNFCNPLFSISSRKNISARHNYIQSQLTELR